MDCNCLLRAPMTLTGISDIRHRAQMKKKERSRVSR